MYVMTDATGRVVAVTDREELADGMTEVEEPEGFDPSLIGDWVLSDGELVRDGAQTDAIAETDRRIEEQRSVAEAASDFFAGGGLERMQDDIDEAKASGGADPALASFVTLALPMIAPTAKDSALAPVMRYAPDYVPEGHAYEKGEVFKTEDGRCWRVSQDFTSQAQWVLGGAGLDALFYSITIAPDGVIVWAQPRGEFDAPDKGDERHYPDADGPVYVSLVNDNAYSPDAVPDNWQLEEA